MAYKYAKNRSLEMVEVETDSRTAFTLITQNTATSWRYNYIVRNVRKLLTEFQGCKLTYREQNQVADGFAKWGPTVATDMEYNSLAEVPRHIQQLLFFDRIGLPSFRPRCN